MKIGGYTHALLDLGSGTLVGAAKDVSHLEGNGYVGVVWFFDEDADFPLFLDHYEVLSLDRMDASVHQRIRSELLARCGSWVC